MNRNEKSYEYFGKPGPEEGKLRQRDKNLQSLILAALRRSPEFMDKAGGSEKAAVVVGVALNQLIMPIFQQQTEQAPLTGFLSQFALPTRFDRIFWSTFLSARAGAGMGQRADELRPAIKSAIGDLLKSEQP
ncbi:unnamed protein product [Amoebophrya sp. A25]|nr:unnamed protein product [Amoebophrya sp. A25]|eukprot:GSA25T00022339001.1